MDLQKLFLLTVAASGFCLTNQLYSMNEKYQSLVLFNQLKKHMPANELNKVLQEQVDKLVHVKIYLELEQAAKNKIKPAEILAVLKQINKNNLTSILEEYDHSTFFSYLAEAYIVTQNCSENLYRNNNPFISSQAEEAMKKIYHSVKNKQQKNIIKNVKQIIEDKKLESEQYLNFIKQEKEIIENYF